MLHITNGDSAARTLREAGLPGDALAWRDVLAEGPVPAGLSLEELAPARARFLADAGWADYDVALADLRRQYATLAASGEQDEVVLWFEHDLHDQLQLAQLLDWFATRTLGRPASLRLIMIGEHPEVSPFYGLGQLTPTQLAALFPARLPATPDQLALGRAAWAAFRSPDPRDVEVLVASDTSALPYLGAALVRHLEEFPDTDAGLSRTERQILEIVADGPIMLFEAFKRNMDRETAPFLGDLGFWARVAALAPAGHPLLAFADGRPFALNDDPAQPREWARQQVALTETGTAVLAGQQDWVRLNGIDRWLGGVHLTGPKSPWRWERTARQLMVG